MKRVLPGFFLIVFITNVAWGQITEEEKFYHYGVRLGYANIMDANASNSFSLGFEARAPLFNSMSGSLNMEMTNFTSTLADSFSKKTFAYHAVVDYYSKSSEGYQIFAGIGPGYLQSGLNDNGAIIFSRLGISYQAFKISLEYNHTKEESTRYWGLYLDVGF